MKIVVHAAGAMREEFFSRTIPLGTRIAAVESPFNFIDHPDASIFFDLEPDPDNREFYQRLSPLPVIVNSVIDGLSAYRYLPNIARINAWPGMINRSILELVCKDPLTTKNIEICLNKMTWNYRFVPDIPGMVSARMIAMIINEAYFALGEKVSSREEIDIAMRTGTNYPLGPFEWASRIGVGKVLQLLQKMNEENGRYNIAPALLEEVQISA
jgi:3-hydroxybutyryl-CoA dehydrogenase